uniref:C2 domain-containing protein n=1 Tax=Rhizophora mucronata TaxID=61149 RepID=A0A2P2MXQ3_RHIMU
MASREVEVIISSAKDLKNVNWRNGPVRPYAVLWVDPKYKCSTKVDEEGDTCPVWDETLVIPLPPGPVEDQTLYIDIVHAGSEEDTKPLIGSAKLKLHDVIEDVGYGERAFRNLKLKRSSGRPHGKVEVKVAIREPRYRAPDPDYAPSYGVQRTASREYAAPYEAVPRSYGNPYAPPPPNPYYSAPPGGYPYGAPPQPAYGQPHPAYGQPQPGYGQPQPAYGGQPSYGEYQQPVYVQEEKKKSKFGGMGTGLAVGAAAGALGGLALAEGFDALEDKIADDAAEKVEDDLGYDGDDF